jgi:hypothetical protein
VIENTALEEILLTATDLSTVCEIYDADAVPGDDGLDPDDALDCFAAIDGITFRGRDYKRLVKKFGRIKRTIGEEVNSASVEFSNLDNQISQFEFNNGFEGLIIVIRLLSRSQSVVLTDSQILFTGRCEKPKSGNRQSLTVTAKFILDAMQTHVPRRKFSKEDQEGRVASDPEFEGFLYTPTYGTVSFPRVEHRGGFLGWWNRKTVMATKQWSSFSDLDANKPVPEVFGRAQLMGVHISYVDVGTALRLRTAFCEGEIEDIINARTTDTEFPLSATSYVELLGLVGSLNGPDDPGWAGATGYFSRTAHIRGQADNSSVEDTDPAPDVVAVILGRLMLTPDGSGDWVTTQWTDNGAAHTRFLLTSPDYCNLDENWIDDPSFLETFDYNAEQIFDMSISDFSFVEPA